jgi:stearoyl-CoA desaturase (delta-9 desaturase)
MKQISLYQFTGILFWILTIVGLYSLYINQDWWWLIGLWFMIRFNHMCLSLHHRLISHKSFTARSKFIHNLIIVLSVFQVNHSPLKFAISHRHHHKNSDKGADLDVHGPSTGFFNTLLTWEFNLENKQTILKMKIPRDLLRDKFLLWFDKHYYKVLVLVSIIILLTSVNFFFYVYVPAAVLWKIEANLFVNWYCHKFGYSNYFLDTDGAKNNSWAGWLTMGEGWHNNHHAQPSNYNFGHKPWEIDTTAWLIKHCIGK